MATTQKLSCHHLDLVGRSLPRPTLFCFGLVWSNHITGKMYPEMDIHRTLHNIYHKNLVSLNELIKVELPP